MKRYIAIHEKYGIFITSYGGAAFFSDNDPFGFTRCESFENLEDANSFFQARMPDHLDEFEFKEVESKSEKVDVVDIIKSGYTSKHVESMFMNVLPLNTTLH